MLIYLCYTADAVWLWTHQSYVFLGPRKSSRSIPGPTFNQFLQKLYSLAAGTLYLQGLKSWDAVGCH